MRENGCCIVAVVGRKGGAGKTTTALNLAGALGEAGHQVVMVDLDPQRSLARLLPDGVVRDLAGEAELHRAHGDTAVWLERVLVAHETVVIDTPPLLGETMIAAITIATCVVVPTRLAQQDIDSLLDTLTHCPLGATLIVPNAVTARRRNQRETIAALRARYAGSIAAREIADSAIVEDAMSAGLPVVAYRKASAPAAAYRQLAREVLHRHAQSMAPTQEGALSHAQ